MKITSTRPIKRKTPQQVKIQAKEVRRPVTAANKIKYTNTRARAVNEAVARLVKKQPSIRNSFAQMREVVATSQKELSNLKTQLERDRIFTGSIEKKYARVEAERRSFISEFSKFTEHSVQSAKSSKLRDFDAVKFGSAEIRLQSFRKNKNALLNEIIKSK